MFPNAERASPQSETMTANGDGQNQLPAFLDLADSTARLNSNLPDINARIEQKRQEHERQRLLQRRHFEEQMAALERQQQQEERALLAPPQSEALNGDQHIANSAPTTPPRVSSTAPGGEASLSNGATTTKSSLHHQVITNGLSNEYKRHSANYSAIAPPSEGLLNVAPGSHNHTAGAKSMPGSRRGSSGSSDAGQDMISSLNLASLSIRDPTSSRPNGVSPLRSATHPEGLRMNAAHLFDEDLDNEMSKSLRQLPTQTEDERVNVRANYTRKLSVSGSALDLAPLQQTRAFPRGSELEGPRTSEWPQYSGLPRPAEIGGHRLDRSRSVVRSVTIGAIGSDLGNTGSGPGTPLISRSPDVSRRPSPPSVSTFSDAPSINTLTTNATSFSSARSVPATPLNLHSNTSLRAELGVASAKTLGGVPISPALHDRASSDAHRAFDSAYGRGYDNITFGSIRADEALPTQIVGDTLYSSNGSEYQRQTNYGGYGTGSRLSDNVPDLAGGFYGGVSRNGYSGFGLPGGARVNGIEKMNGLGGPKHKRGDMDREFNRFAGTRLEDLQGDIPALCKDQHGCRYLQKKLEEGVSEQRDMIFSETFNHLSDLMTDPFGNYLCQKLLEYSTDEQRNLICESVAQDLVQISLNMHGTRAVQKMIDFLSNQRQTDTRYDAQVHTIIVALSMHVVTLIKDLNGNHVVQKCLNKLAPEDNQFIYNAVAAHCVEVATHRHGCCVLQRCVDHASDAQRIQLVTEITYHALTLVQDPYGNYVVQYILDLNDNRFSDAVIRQFIGNVCALSVQKFSSNVIEKCIRVAEHSTRKMVIEEFLNRSRLEKLLRDSFGNYCVQTALDYAEANQRMMLVEGIRPILPLIRNTPYGKRIQSKLQRDQLDNGGQFGNGPGHYGQLGMSTSNLQSHRNPYGGHSIRRSSQIIPDPYSQPQSMYGQMQNNLIPPQVRSMNTAQLENFVSPQQFNFQPRSTSALSGQNTAFTNVAPAYTSSMNSSMNGTNNYGPSMTDPYQRAAYGYL